MTKLEHDGGPFGPLLRDRVQRHASVHSHDAVGGGFFDADGGVLRRFYRRTLAVDERDGEVGRIHLGRLLDVGDGLYENAQTVAVDARRGDRRRRRRRTLRLISVVFIRRRLRDGWRLLHRGHLASRFHHHLRDSQIVRTLRRVDLARKLPAVDAVLQKVHKEGKVVHPEFALSRRARDVPNHSEIRVI